jgi:hypothetical protein
MSSLSASSRRTNRGSIRRLIVLAVSALQIVWAAAKFSSCRALLSVYSQGIAKDAAAARAVFATATRSRECRRASTRRTG